MWLAEVGELRLLFDPLLEDRHDGGVFEVTPARQLEVSALDPDFLVVSHRHPDHFDVDSLATLAFMDPQIVVLTSDPFVERVCKQLGFSHVTRLRTFDRVDVQGASLVTTPSRGAEIEWGMAVTNGDGTAWNQVDTILRDSADVRETVSRLGAELRDQRQDWEGDARRVIDLALVRWQPLLEVAPMLAGHIGFPLRSYIDILDQAAAIGAGALVPASAGVRHTDAFAWLNRACYPVRESRVVDDLRRRVPTSRVYPIRIGGSYLLERGEVGYEENGARALVWSSDEPVRATFRPFEIPPIVDPNPHGEKERNLRNTVEEWIPRELVPGLERASAELEPALPLVFVLEVVFPTTSDFYRFHLSAGGVRWDRSADADYDALNVVAGSLLVEVARGERHWGEGLLAGLLRGSDRSYRVSAEGAHAIANLQPLFLYYAMDYQTSFERCIAGRVERALGARGPR